MRKSILNTRARNVQNTRNVRNIRNAQNTRSRNTANSNLRQINNNKIRRASLFLLRKKGLSDKLTDLFAEKINDINKRIYIEFFPIQEKEVGVYIKKGYNKFPFMSCDGKVYSGDYSIYNFINNLLRINNPLFYSSHDVIRAMYDDDIKKYGEGSVQSNLGNDILTKEMVDRKFKEFTRRRNAFMGGNVKKPTSLQKKYRNDPLGDDEFKNDSGIDQNISSVKDNMPVIDDYEMYRDDIADEMFQIMKVNRKK